MAKKRGSYTPHRHRAYLVECPNCGNEFFHSTNGRVGVIPPAEALEEPTKKSSSIMYRIVVLVLVFAVGYAIWDFLKSYL